MSSVADLLGIVWDGAGARRHTLSVHARRQCAAKGISERDVLAAADSPAHSYPNGRVPGQMRHVRGGVCAVVDPATLLVVTVYANVVETDLREDQRVGDGAADALAFERRRQTPAA